MSTKHNPSPDWHALPIEEVFDRLNARPEGLSHREAERRLAEHGPNRLPEPRRRGPLVRFLLQFHNVLIYVLLVASVITALLGHWVDFAVILGVVVINALIGFIQEGKAERALESIRRLLTHEAVVLRDGRRETIPAEGLVPGDIVFLQSGDKIPADLRLSQVKSLHVEEAMLTGESVPVEKRPDPVAPLATLGDRFGMAFSGTLVTSGTAQGLVVETGAKTELGRINQMLAEVQTLTTPLLQQMAAFARLLTLIIIALAGGTFAFGYYLRDYSPTEMFLAAVGLIVAAIPEGLPAIITITLAIGVQRMARRKAIIRQLPAVETLGAVTVICSDKTGTLTRNEMTVSAVATADHLFEVRGVGYDPHGSFVLGEKEVDPDNHPTLAEMGRAAMLCNDAELVETAEGWRIDGDPTEGALLTLGRKMGLERDFEARVWPRTDVIPFESEHRFMATLHHNHAGHGFIYLKGAPERVLAMCSRQRCKGEDVVLNLPYWKGRVEELAGRGMRVLAIAFKVTPQDFSALNFRDVEAGLTLLGLCGIIDPPSQEAIEAVAECRTAGIRVKMITGDHALTARAIGATMGIGDGTRAVTGEELETMGDEELGRLVPQVDIFARATPEHKLRLVTALQAHREVVAMTGDGVNDAPALKRANIGIAMGIKGTEVSKEAAEMVLADDNFASIAHAVEEGRTVYDNIRKAILFILPTNGAEALIILAAIALGRTLPITPAQILWINMITAVTLALALAFEPKEVDVMRRPPRDPQGPILGSFLLWRLTYVSLILVVGTFGMFLWARAEGLSIEASRTIAVNTLVFFEAWYLLNTRYLHDPVLSFEGLFGNRYVIMAIAAVVVFQLAFTYLPPMQTLFGTAAIEAAVWGRILLVTVSVFVLVELEKVAYKLWEKRKG